MTRVPYLEVTDFNPDGSLKMTGKPVVLMVQGVFCGYCTKAKPDFQQFAQNSKKALGATLQMDGGPSEKSAMALIKQFAPPGVPQYLGFDSQGKFVRVHSGGRDVASLMAFADSLN